MAGGLELVLRLFIGVLVAALLLAFCLRGGGGCSEVVNTLYIYISP